MTRRYVVFLLGIVPAIWASAAIAQVPETLAAPGKVIATFHAEGAQVYECKAGGDGTLAWTFREPIATLLLNGKTVGRHYAGPTWELSDSSAITGKTAASAPGATTNDVPWLKLNVASHRGSGLLSKVATVQRLNTQGGELTGACDHAGSFRSVAYSADYSFIGKPIGTPAVAKPSH
jgi:hypothetical protein